MVPAPAAAAKPEMVSNVVIKRYILYFSFLCKIHGDKYVNDINCKEFSSVIKNGSTLASIVSYCRLRPKKNMITDIADFIFVNFIR